MRIREDGATSEEILSGVKRYAAYVLAMGKSGTEFIKQAKTFFGPSCHYEDGWQIPQPRGVGNTKNINQISRPNGTIPPSFRGVNMKNISANSDVLARLKKLIPAGVTPRFNGGGSEAALIDDLCKVDMLVLDEVSIQRESRGEMIILNQVIDRRLSAMKPVGVLTNLIPD